MRKQNLSWVILIFVLPLLACSLSLPGRGKEAAQPAGQDTAPTAPAAEQPATEPLATEQQATEQPATEQPASPTEAAGDTVQAGAETSTPAGDQASAATQSSKFTGVAGLDQMSSYRVNFAMAFDGKSGDKPAKGRIAMTLEETKNPPARHLMMSMEGTTVEEMGGMNSMDLYTMDGKVYMKNPMMGNTWVSFAGDSAQAFNEGFFKPDQQLEIPKTANCDAQPTTVNGVAATHCTFTEKDVPSDEATVDSLQGEVWVAAEGGYIVKLDFKAEGYRPTKKGEGDIFDSGSVSFTYDVTDINGNFTITLPEAAKNATDMGAMMGGDTPAGGDSSGATGSEPGQAADIPVMDNAQDTVSMAGFTTYTTPSPLADVVTFYRQKLTADGWKENTDQSFSSDSSAVLNFTKEGKTCMVTLSAEGNKTNVVVGVQ